MHQQDVVLQAKWKQFLRELTHRWRELDSEELNRVDGKRDNLVCLLQARYGYVRHRAEREVDLFIDEFTERLRRAA